MIALYIYIGFSWLFMIGSLWAYREDNEIGFIPAIIGVVLGPLIMPIELGHSATKAGK